MADFFYFGSYFCLLITAYLLFFHTSTYQTYSSKILGFVMTVYAISITGYLLLISEFILTVPFLYKTFAPFNLLIPPLGYLYIRAVVQNERKIKWNDFFHFVPFLIFVGSYTPFYLMPIKEKLEIVNAVLSNRSQNIKSQDGIIPETGYYLARLIQSVTYLYFQWRLIRNAEKQTTVSFAIPHKASVIKWLKFFIFMPMIAFLAIIALVVVVMNSSGNAQGGSTNWYSLIVSMSIFSFSVYLLLNPRLLYGIPFSGNNEVSKKINKELSNLELDFGDMYAKDIQIIEDAFKKDKIYLTPNLNINLLSVMIGVPARDLSFIINNHYKSRFTDFINKYRIGYIVEKLEQGWLDQFTLQALATNAGFMNKATFNTAFKKHVGLTPSEYIQLKSDMIA